ncbi:MAG TPA: menaquinone biosynthesis decarboxylase [Bacteroidota bacterium]|nr:menaquinone biosynthesis decarboxylase [Bacteroidota bacterium]
MDFRSLGEFVRYLESVGELVRVSAEVDPVLEVTEISTRALKERMPALLFENVKGSRFPLAINTLASERRIELALGKDSDRLGKELVEFVERAIPPSGKTLSFSGSVLRRIVASRVRRVSRPLSQQVVDQPNLDALPVIKCWPGDGGRFVTLPQVVTYDPNTGKRNIGMYRMHVFDARTTGMHWQIQKGGGFHYYQADKLNKPFELAVALGTDPAMLLATVAALPEGMDEAMFAGFLRTKPTEMTKGRTIGIEVPANAEFVLEGVVQPAERKMEGPFGDHFGHYSAASEFPVFHLTAVTHRKNPVYPATVVGIPPMEDKFLGDATQRILGPLARLLHSEVRGLWAYYEAGFHNLLVVSIEERYQKEAMKTALGLLGMGQLSLTKCLIAVSEDVDPRDFRQVLKSVRENFDPHYDFIMLPKVPLDTLDFTSYTMNLGSKMILDATRKRREVRRERDHGRVKKTDVLAMDRRILDARFIADGFLLVKVQAHGRSVVERLLRKRELQHLTLVAVVSEDVDLTDKENYIWGVFTRFDCERDVIFSKQKLVGISPVYEGVMGIDATWKTGYPETLRMDEEIVRKVDNRWNEYWKVR